MPKRVPPISMYLICDQWQELITNLSGDLHETLVACHSARINSTPVIARLTGVVLTCITMQFEYFGSAVVARCQITVEVVPDLYHIVSVALLSDGYEHARRKVQKGDNWLSHRGQNDET
jgi:hypothetical protein